MRIDALFHVAIKARDVRATQRFYVDVLGMAVEARPEIGFPGIWLRHSLPGGSALLHIYAGDAALEADDSFAQGTGVIDHVALVARGYYAYRDRFRDYHLRWRENTVADAGLWQLFVYDPSAVLLELSFSGTAEDEGEPNIVPALQYRPRENFFHAEDYVQFAST